MVVVCALQESATYQVSPTLTEAFSRIPTDRLEFIVRQLQLIAQKYNSCTWNMTTLDKILFARYLEDVDTVRIALV
jgi:hypothetical protein